jgi:hypothetical protein
VQYLRFLQTIVKTENQFIRCRFVRNLQVCKSKLAQTLAALTTVTPLKLYVSQLVSTKFTKLFSQPFRVTR